MAGGGGGGGRGVGGPDPQDPPPPGSAPVRYITLRHANTCYRACHCHTSSGPSCRGEIGMGDPSPRLASAARSPLYD